MGRCSGCGREGRGEGVCSSCGYVITHMNMVNDYQDNLVSPLNDAVTKAFLGLFKSNKKPAPQQSAAPRAAPQAAAPQSVAPLPPGPLPVLSDPVAEAAMDPRSLNISVVVNYIAMYNARDPSFLRYFVNRYYRPDWASMWEGAPYSSNHEEACLKIEQGMAIGVSLFDLFIADSSPHHVHFTYKTFYPSRNMTVPVNAVISFDPPGKKAQSAFWAALAAPKGTQVTVLPVVQVPNPISLDIAASLEPAEMNVAVVRLLHDIYNSGPAAMPLMRAFADRYYSEKITTAFNGPVTVTNRQQAVDASSDGMSKHWKFTQVVIHKASATHVVYSYRAHLPEYKQFYGNVVVVIFERPGFIVHSAYFAMN